MRIMLIVGYFCFLCICIVLYFINQIIINNIEKGASEVIEFEKIIKDSLAKYRNMGVKCNICIKKDRYFGYDTQNKISIKDKCFYTEYDVFVFLHELGHAIEHQKHKKIYDFIFVLNRIVLMLYVIIVPINLISMMTKTNTATIFINILFFSLFAAKFLSIYWIEKSASMWAIKLTKSKNKQIYIKISILSNVNQHIFYLLLLAPIMLTLIVSNIN